MKLTRIELQRLKKLGNKKFELYAQKLAVEAQIIGLNVVKQALSSEIEKVSKEYNKLLKRYEK